MARSNNRYDMIILESARLFRERGYLATSIRDIGEALDITSAALYYHFKNKDELLLAVMEKALTSVIEAVQRSVANEPDPGEAIRIAMRTHLAISTEFQDFAIVLLQETRHLSAEARAKVIAQRDAYDALWDDLFAAAQSAGMYKPHVDVRLLRLLTFGAMNLVVTWYKTSGTYRAEEIAEALFDYASRGVTSESFSFIGELDSE